MGVMVCDNNFPAFHNTAGGRQPSSWLTANIYAYAQTVEPIPSKAEIGSEPHRDEGCKQWLRSSHEVSGDILISCFTLTAPAFLRTDLHHRTFAGSSEHKPSPIKEATHLVSDLAFIANDSRNLPYKVVLQLFQSPQLEQYIVDR